MQKQSRNIKTKAYLSILIIHVISSSSSSLSSPLNFIEVKRKFRFELTRRRNRRHSSMQGFSDRTMRSPRNFSRMLRRLITVEGARSYQGVVRWETLGTRLAQEQYRLPQDSSLYKGNTDYTTHRYSYAKVQRLKSYKYNGLLYKPILLISKTP